MPYKIIADELQVLEAIGEFRDINNNLVGYDHRANLYLEGEVVSDQKVSPVIKEALENEDENDPIYQHLVGKIEKVGAGKEQLDAARRLGLPFDNYEELSEDEIVAALRVLSGPVVQTIKEYEAANEARPAILTYNAGTREAERDRLDGDPSLLSDRQDADEDKDAGKIQTREVSEDDVVPGEGYTGSDPVREPGKAAAVRGSGDKPRSRQRRNRSQSGGSESQNPDTQRDGADS